MESGGEQQDESCLFHPNIYIICLIMEMVDQSKSWFLPRGTENYLGEREITVKMS